MHWVGGGGLMSGKGTKNLQVMFESMCMNVVFFFTSYCNAKKASITCAYFCVEQLSISIKFIWIELNWIIG